MLKRKDMKRTDWKRILQKEYLFTECNYCGKNGIASILILREITEPLTIHYEYGDVTIANQNDTWLQVALEDTYYWATAMYTPQNELIQIYFDITNGSCFADRENPTFEDLFLDIVMEADGTLHVLDRDELDGALEKREISEEQYERALMECEKLYKYLLVNGETFAAFCYQQLLQLKGA